MSKRSEELVKVSGTAVERKIKKTIKLPSIAAEKEQKVEPKAIDNIISIDSLKHKNTSTKNIKRTLCLNLGNNKNTIQDEEVNIENDETFENVINKLEQIELIDEMEEIKTQVTPVIDSPTITSSKRNTSVQKDKKPVINLASPFFYAPSVFEQYSIEVSDADNIEENIENKSYVVENVKENVINKPDVVECIKKDIVKKPDFVENVKDDVKVIDSTEQAEPIVENNFVDLDALISQDSINESYCENLNIPIEEAPVKEVASAVGILVETPDSKPKITTPNFSNFKSIFKKFSYDEAELVNSANELVDDSPSIQNINTISEVQKTLENAKIGQEKNVTELNVQANPIATIPVLENDINVISAIDSPNYGSENDVNILNILTPETNSFDIENELSLDDSFEEDNSYDDDNFSIESYFDLDASDENDDLEENLLDDNADIEFDKIEPTEENISKLLNEQSPYISNLFTSLTDTINSLTNRIAELEKTKVQPVESFSDSVEEEIIEEAISTPEEIDEEEQAIIADIIRELDEEFVFEGDYNDSNVLENQIDELDDIIIEDNDSENIEDSLFENMLDDISLDDIDLDDLSSLTIADVISENKVEEESTDLSNTEDLTESEVENILEDAISSDENLKEKLLTELFNDNSYAVPEESTPEIKNADEEVTSDFVKVIDMLTQTISTLEEKSTNDVQPIEVFGKAINIEIDKDDIFSISILNETYEIVADFDGISVLSENIHISTPKNNFFVKIGENYIEIHNYKSYFEVYTSFEDIEFENALNNVAFAKKNNRIELTIKESFKLSSVDNKVSLSMLNTSIADIEGAQASNKDNEETSVCDNNTLVISEETQKVYLPYTIKDIIEKINNVSNGYQTVQDVIDEEYTVPLSEFKMPIISRFKEAYKFMRTKEHSSVYAAIDLALELMFNSNLNPAVIRASKNLRELNIYLDCLYENELEKFDCFKVIYKVLPKIQ